MSSSFEAACWASAVCSASGATTTATNIGGFVWLSLEISLSWAASKSDLLPPRLGGVIRSKTGVGLDDDGADKSGAAGPGGDGIVDGDDDGIALSMNEFTTTAPLLPLASAVSITIRTAAPRPSRETVRCAASAVAASLLSATALCRASTWLLLLLLLLLGGCVCPEGGVWLVMLAVSRSGVMVVLAVLLWKAAEEMMGVSVSSQRWSESAGWSPGSEAICLAAGGLCVLVWLCSVYRLARDNGVHRKSGCVGEAGTREWYTQNVGLCG